jgi:hypothetical protein
MGLMLLTAACGNSTTTYTNSAYHFSVAYDASLLRAFVDTANSGRATMYPATPVETIVVDFYDKRARDDYSAAEGLGQVQVSASRASRVVTPPTLAALRALSKKDFLGIPGVGLKRALAKGVVVGEWQPFTLDGLHGFSVAAYTPKVMGVSYQLFDGRYVYYLDMLAARSAWPAIEPALKAVVDSFRATCR